MMVLLYLKLDVLGWIFKTFYVRQSFSETNFIVFNNLSQLFFVILHLFDIENILLCSAMSMKMVTVLAGYAESNIELCCCF